MTEIAGGEGPHFGDIIAKNDGEQKVLRKCKSLNYSSHEIEKSLQAHRTKQAYIRRKSYRPENKALGGPQEHQEFHAWEDDHPICKLFALPNLLDCPYDLWAYSVLFSGLTGECHWWVMRNQFGVPVEIWVIPSHWMRLVTGRDGMPEAWAIQSPWGTLQYAPYDDVLSFYEHSPLNRYEGWSITLMISEWIDNYEAMVRARLAQSINGAIPAFHVALSDEYVDPDEAMLNRYYAKWFARFQGPDNTGKPLITGPGVEVKPLGLTPVEMGYKDTEDQYRDMILAAYRVPKGVLGMEPSSDVSCHDTETECLTASGWIKYDQITLQTRVACYDSTTNSIVYRNPTRIIRSPYKGPMHRWKSPVAGVDALMTPNHKGVFKGSGPKSDWYKREVGNLAPSQSYWIKTAAKAACATPATIEVEAVKRGLGNTRPKLRDTVAIDPEAWMDFLGWFLSEGHTCIRYDKNGTMHSEVGITQKIDSEWVADIDACLVKTGLKFNKHLNVARNTYDWKCNDHGLVLHLRKHCGEGALHKKVPEYVKDWPAEYLQILLNSLISGDGSRYSKRAWCLFTGSKQLADDTQELATKCGWRSSIVPREQKDRNIDGRPLPDSLQYRVNLLVDSPERTIRPEHRTIEEYDGIVWCLEVPTGIFVTRRNGCTLISSNSYAPQRQFVRFAINPYLGFFAQRCTHGLLRRTPQCEQGTMFWHDRVVDDPETLRADITLQMANGMKSPNEGRAEYGYEPWPHGGNDPMINSQPVPWATGQKQEQDEEVEQAMQRATRGKLELNEDDSDEPLIVDKDEESPVGPLLKWHRTYDGDLEAAGAYRWKIERNKDKKGKNSYTLYKSGEEIDSAGACGLLKQLAENEEQKVNDQNPKSMSGATGASGGYTIPAQVIDPDKKNFGQRYVPNSTATGHTGIDAGMQQNPLGVSIEDRQRLNDEVSDMLKRRNIILGRNMVIGNGKH